MYGSIFRMRPKAGREKEIMAHFEEWGRTRAPKVKGARAGYVLRPSGQTDELVGVAVFQDKNTYVANANDPEQDKWYRKLRDMLEADPIWQDGDYVVAATGNPDARRVVEENFAAFNAHDLDRGAATVSASSTLLDVPSGMTLIGPTGLRQYWQGWLTAFPDGRCDITKCVATDDGTVITEFNGRGTHNGPLTPLGGSQQIPATGRRVDIPFSQIATVSDGKITSAKLYYDVSAMLGQLGLTPEMAPARAATGATASAKKP